MIQTTGSTQKGSVGRGLEAFACDGGPLRGSVWVDLRVLLELAKRAELSVQDLALLTKAQLTFEPLSAVTKAVSGQSHAGATAKGLSPIAAKVQSVQRGMALCQTEVHEPVTAGGECYGDL
jgi:hypothetical protein